MRREMERWKGKEEKEEDEGNCNVNLRHELSLCLSSLSLKYVSPSTAAPRILSETELLPAITLQQLIATNIVTIMTAADQHANVTNPFPNAETLS